MNLHICPPPKAAQEYTTNRLERDVANRVRSTVLIDLPNIRRGAERYSRAPLNWERIAQSVRSDTAGSVETTTEAFEMVSNDFHETGQRLSRLERALRPLNASVSANPPTKRMDGDRRRDIDPLIHGAMWSAVAMHMTEELGESVMLVPIQHRFILFSGDGEFVDTRDKILESYRDKRTGEMRVELELVVYSWERSLSARLYAAANRIVFLDTMPGIFA